jgi:hypothetical protein
MKKSLKLPTLIAVALSTALLSSTLAVAAPEPGKVGSTTLRSLLPGIIYKMALVLFLCQLI